MRAALLVMDFLLQRAPFAYAQTTAIRRYYLVSVDLW
jgi:hypothetical protein